MKRSRTFLATLALALTSILPAVGEIGLISPLDAKKLIESSDIALRPLVFDTRGGYKDYFRGHLPSAHHLAFDTLRGTADAIPVQYLPEDLTRQLLIRAGVRDNRTHLVYANGAALPNDEVLSATMVAYVMEKSGIRDIRIVDGGLAGWTDAGFPAVQKYTGNPAGRLAAKGGDSIAVTAAEVIALKDKPGYVLVDARPMNEYLGQDDIWLRKGHIPGAISFHWARLMDSANTHKFKPLSETKADLEAAGITPDKEILCYCGTSREGSLLRFYLKHVAGYPKVRLYEGAWKEYVWLENQSLPVETVAEPTTE